MDREGLAADIAALAADIRRPYHGDDWPYLGKDDVLGLLDDYLGAHLLDQSGEMRALRNAVKDIRAQVRRHHLGVSDFIAKEEAAVIVEEALSPWAA
jgi:hypothetical protein